MENKEKGQQERTGCEGMSRKRVKALERTDTLHRPLQLYPTNLPHARRLLPSVAKAGRSSTSEAGRKFTCFCPQGGKCFVVLSSHAQQDRRFLRAVEILTRTLEQQ